MRRGPGLQGPVADVTGACTRSAQSGACNFIDNWGSGLGLVEQGLGTPLLVAGCSA